MRVSAWTLLALGAIAALVALGVTDQVLPSSEPNVASVRPWVASRALGIAAYLLLAVEVAAGLILSHPKNTSTWKLTRSVFPWHEMLTVFTGAFIVLHVTLIVIDPYANVGIVGALVPGFSQYRPPAVALGSVALYALIFTAASAKWTSLLPSGWWLKVHRFAAVAFLLTWIHALVAGTDGSVLSPMYLATGLPILAGVAHRWWTARVRPQRAVQAAASLSTPSIGRPMPVAAVLED